MLQCAPHARIIPGGCGHLCKSRVTTAVPRQPAIAAFAARKARPRGGRTKAISKEIQCSWRIYRQISLLCRAESRRLSQETVRDSSTSLGMTEWLVVNGI